MSRGMCVAWLVVRVRLSVDNCQQLCRNGFMVAQDSVNEVSTVSEAL